MPMRIFTKKAFGFVKPDAGHYDKIAGTIVNEMVRTRVLDFCDVPDWVADDDMFKWAVADGDIEVIQTPATVAVSDKGKK